jgi:polysaccharide deacetylase 2 family uncharacterized protein YibQ
MSRKLSKTKDKLSMASATDTDKTRFSFKSFGRGLVVVALIYVVLFGIAVSKQDQTAEALQNRLASLTVLVDNKGSLSFRIKPNEQEHSETETSTTEESHTEHVAEQPHEAEEPQEEENLNLEDIVSQQSKALREAPVEGFYEVTSAGKLPIAKSQHQTPFEIYRKPFVLNKTKPYISIAINDYGLSDPLSREMVDALPSSVTFILSPYSKQPNDWIGMAREDGHEVWLNMPIENKDFPYSDPGAKGLLTRVSLQYNQDRLEWVLGRAVGYTGIAAFTDGALDNARNVFEKMTRDMFGRGLGYFEMNTADDSFFLPLVKGLKAPHAQSNATIEIVDEDGPEIQKVYGTIEKNGHAVVVITPSPVNLKGLKSWLVSLEEQGVASVPLSSSAAPDTERN